jgi:ketosteroid isomerase-like protein
MHPNEELIRGLDEAFGSNDMSGIDERFADGVVWHAPGRARNSGTRRGKPELFEVMGDLAKVTGGTLRGQIHDVLANDDHVVVLQTTLGEREGMPSLEDTEVVVFHVRHGKVTEVWEHPGDLYAVDQFFA